MGVAFSSRFCNAGNASMPADLRRLDALIDLLVDVLLREIEGEAEYRAVEQRIDQRDSEREAGNETASKPDTGNECTTAANRRAP
jgi:hypothetical protein